MPAIPASTRPRWCVVGRTHTGDYEMAQLADSADAAAPVAVRREDFPAVVEKLEAQAAPRWVWSSTAALYPELLRAGVQVARCHDLRLCQQILANASSVQDHSPFTGAEAWAPGTPAPTPSATQSEPSLFDLDIPAGAHAPQESLHFIREEFARQRAAVVTSSTAGRLSLLLAAESAGALIAAELTAAGVPWDTSAHDEILTAALGPRPLSPNEQPRLLAAAGTAVRNALGDPSISLDSPPKLLRALRAAGIDVSSTSRWELEEHDHPAIAPLLHYKKLVRLHTANGWAWLDEWVSDGRYRPVYIPGGVVTGRWASSGGGALQLPRALRPALRADPGWTLVTADVSQLEPRVLAAMAGDRAMAAAGAGKDLYSGIVESGSIETRGDAKLAMLGAMYGATSGESGRLLPRLRRAFPNAMRIVDSAAEVGANGGTVSTWLGRSSPAPDADWQRLQAAASLPGATPSAENAARRAARERGRFTRNFVVQGTAAEWALAWLADLRQRLMTLAAPADAPRASRSGPAFESRPHLTFFLHDEIIVHTPVALADEVAAAVTASADAAAAVLFPGGLVDFRLDLRIAPQATKA